MNFSYGSRQTTEECTISIFIQCAQSIVGVLIQACMAGVVFAKLARAKSRASTVVFSKTAVITMRNKELFLLFRVGNKPPDNTEQKPRDNEAGNESKEDVAPLHVHHGGINILKILLMITIMKMMINI